MINENCVAAKEVNIRLGEAYTTWKKLGELWKRGNIDIKTKIVVYDAIIRAKSLYGLDSLQLKISNKN